VFLNAFLRTIEEWGAKYEIENTREYPPGKLVPKVTVAAVRGSVPYRPNRTSGICSIYMDVRIPPHREILDVKRELEGVLNRLDLDLDLEMFMSRKGLVGKNSEPLVEAITKCFKEITGQGLGTIPTEEMSMWRDINVFNAVGIPSVTFGPPRWILENPGEEERRGSTDPGGKAKYFDREDLVNAAKVYARLALDMCGKDGIPTSLSIV
jgi:acetylornithine deacetylase/succinyl-diaminopimelate desuccinylase-like protein